MSAIQQFLATLVANARKPGAIKSIAGQLAIAYGSNMVMETAAAAEERAEAANARFERLMAATEVAVNELSQARQMTAAQVKQHAIAGIRDGHLDAEVRDRAYHLGYITGECQACGARDGKPQEPVDMLDAELLDDGGSGGPPETIGAVRDLPGDEPAPPCANLDCVREYRHVGDCRPARPPRMAGLLDEGSGLLAGDGSADRPYRKVETIASVLDDDGDDD